MNKLYIVFILIITLTFPLFSKESEFWDDLSEGEKIVFVVGMRSGYLAALDRATEAYTSVSEATKETPGANRDLVLVGAKEIKISIFNMTMILLLDDDFVSDFVKYLDYYFTNSKNENASDAFPIFMQERIDSGFYGN